jgi:hypothetical protein
MGLIMILAKMLRVFIIRVALLMGVNEAGSL